MSYTGKKYDVNIFHNNSAEKFKAACAIIEDKFPDFEKERLLIDVDGSTIQAYKKGNDEIVIYDDYDIGAVFAESDVDINGLFELLEEPEEQPVLLEA